jgi:hypothetical protein
MHSNNDQNWGVSWMTSSFHINETPKQESKKEPDFFFCCFDPVSNTDHFSPTSPSMTLSISNLLHPILNSKETRMPIFREIFKQMVLHALLEVAVLLCDTAEPCQWRPSVGTSNDSIHSTWTYMLKTEIPTYTWHDGTTKFGRTEALLRRVQKLSEHLLVPTHHTVEDLASNQTVINACRCIAKSLEALPNHDYKRVLGVCEVAQDIFCSITQRDNLKSASSLTDDVSVIKQTQYADESNTPLVDELRLATYNDHATQMIVGQYPEPQKLIVWLTQEFREFQPLYALPATSRSAQSLT